MVSHFGRDFLGNFGMLFGMLYGFRVGHGFGFGNGFRVNDTWANC